MDCEEAMVLVDDPLTLEGGIVVEKGVKGKVLEIAKDGDTDDDPSFIVLTETKFSFRCIPVWDRYSPHRTRVEKKNTCDNALTMTSPVHW